jgi:hypothetical protein
MWQHARCAANGIHKCDILTDQAGDPRRDIADFASLASTTGMRRCKARSNGKGIWRSRERAGSRVRNVTLVDSTVWVDFFAGRSNPETKWLDSAMGYELIGVMDLILCHVLEGVREDRQFKEIKLRMPEFEFFARGGLEMAMASAENCRKLRARDSP